MKRIDAWIDKVYDWYVAELKKNEDKGRFMYLRSNAVPSTDDGGNDADVALYKRYRLSGHKTFESLFFPERDRLLNTLQLFSNKDGKYAIKGYPHKVRGKAGDERNKRPVFESFSIRNLHPLQLGLLLYGPPGTGKTSLIKALAAHTQRNVVMVNLAAIKTWVWRKEEEGSINAGSDPVETYVTLFFQFFNLIATRS